VLDLQRHLLPRLVHCELAEMERFPDGHANTAFLSTFRESVANPGSDFPIDKLVNNITFESDRVFKHNGFALRCLSPVGCAAGLGGAVNRTEFSGHTVPVEVLALLRGNARYDDPIFLNVNYRQFDVMLVRQASPANPTTSGSSLGVISVPAKFCPPSHGQYFFIDPANVPCPCGFIPMYRSSQEGRLSGSSSPYVINQCVY
jgi:hypothetical protein